MKKFYDESLKPYAMAIGKFIHPTVLTTLSYPLSILTAYFILSGHWLAGWMIGFTSLFDLLDGLVARINKKTSKFGDFFDAMTDRIVESIIYLSFFLSGHDEAVFALALSILFSYSAARAEVWTIGKKIRYVGIGSRWQRMLILSLLTIFGMPSVALYMISILSGIGLVQRIVITYMELR